MSSFIGTIARTVKVNKKGEIKGRRRHYEGRGAKLGEKNPRDPCVNPKFKKAPKQRGTTAEPKQKLSFVDSPRRTTDDLRAAHRTKMARKAVARGPLHIEANRPDRVARMLGTPAGINRRTGQPHTHAREIARRTKES